MNCCLNVVSQHFRYASSLVSRSERVECTLKGHEAGDLKVHAEGAIGLPILVAQEDCARLHHSPTGQTSQIVVEIFGGIAGLHLGDEKISRRAVHGSSGDISLDENDKV